GLVRGDVRVPVWGASTGFRHRAVPRSRNGQALVCRSTRSSAIEGEMRWERRRRSHVAGIAGKVLRRNRKRSGDPEVRAGVLRSSSDGVLVQNSAESVDSLDLDRVIEWILRNVRDRDVEIDPALRPSCVVVLDELGENALEVTLVSDEKPVEAFPTRGANELLGERVG